MRVRIKKQEGIVTYEEVDSYKVQNDKIVILEGKYGKEVIHDVIDFYIDETT